MKWEEDKKSIKWKIKFYITDKGKFELHKFPSKLNVLFFFSVCCQKHNYFRIYTWVKIKIAKNTTMNKIINVWILYSQKVHITTFYIKQIVLLYYLFQITLNLYIINKLLLLTWKVNWYQLELSTLFFLSIIIMKSRL